MHVLFLPKWYPGDEDPQLGDFLRRQALAAARHATVSVLAVLPLHAPGSRTRQELHTADGAWELRCYYRQDQRLPLPLRRLVNLLRYRRALLNGWHRVLRERGKPDLLHAHILLRTALVAWYLGWRHGIPWLFSEQGSGHINGAFARRGAVVRTLAAWALRRARRVVAVSDHLGAALLRNGLCSAYAVVPNVVPALDRPLPPPGEAHHVVMVADLVDRVKGISGVLRALAMVRRHEPAAQLTLVGGGPDRGMLEQCAASLGLQDHVRFLGQLPNSGALDAIAGSGLLVVNSPVETFSVVTGEALALGKPVVATRCGGPEAFVNDSNGVLVPVADDAALADALLHVMRTHHRYDPAVLRAGVGGHYGYTAVGERLYHLYRTILSGDAR